MRYLVKIGELKEKIDYLDQQLSIIDENIDSLNKIKTTINWEGPASIAFIDKYDSYIEELKAIEKNTIEFIHYLTTYYDRYSNRYGELRKKYASLYQEEVGNGSSSI